jgi:hypothetical protein
VAPASVVLPSGPVLGFDAAYRTVARSKLLMVVETRPMRIVQYLI